MRPRTIIVTLTALCVLALPAGAALGAVGPHPAPARAAATGASAETLASVAALEPALARQARRATRTAALDRVVRLGAMRARLAGERPRRGAYRRAAGAWPTARLSAHATRLRRAIRELRRTGGAPDVPIPAALRSIAQCESGGNPLAVDASGTYRGLFQFDSGTWASVGGTGDPAAASAEEQYRRAALLYARSGAAPWPVCGR